MHRLLAATVICLGSLSFTLAASAQHEPAPTVAAPHAEEVPAHDGHGHSAADGHGHAAEGHAAHGAAAAHGEHGADHVPTFDDFNWYYGLLFEKEGVEPSLLFRPKGMPVPFAALLLDSLILYYLLYRFAGKSIKDGLKKRKETILRGMEEAAKMRKEAEAQLAAYEEKLGQISDDVARIKKQMRHAAETESARIISEAKERRTRMERDAQILVEQELKAVREQLSVQLMENALESAEASLKRRIGESEQQGFAEEYLRSLSNTASALRGRV